MVSSVTSATDPQVEPEAIAAQDDEAQQGDVMPESARTRHLEHALVLAICLTGLWFLLGQLVYGHFRTVPGDLGDSRFNAIVLEHGYRFLRADAWHRPLWSPRWEFFPHLNALAYSDNLLGTLPIYALLRALRLKEFAAFDAWVITLCIANYAATYLLLRSLKMSRVGAAVGGFLFAFAMPRGQQLNHLQLFPQFFTPLCFFFLVKLRTLRPWAVWGAFGCVVLQLYAAVYLGWFLALALGICASVSLLMSILSRDFRGQLWFGLKQLKLHVFGAMLLSAGALLPMMLHYMRAQSEVGPRHFEEISLMLPRVQSYILPADYSLLYPKLRWLKQVIPMPHEQVMFSGALALGCILLLLFSSFSKSTDRSEAWWRYSFGAIWLLSVVATLWINGTLWSLLYRIIPGGGAIRAVSRIALLQLLPIGVAAAWAATWLEKRAGGGVAVLFAVLIVLENSGMARYAFSIEEHRQRVDRIQSELAVRDCSAFLVSGREEPYKLHLDAMWASLESKVPTSNGYSGNEPPRWFFAELNHVRLGQLRIWVGLHGEDRDSVCLLRH